FRHDRVISYHKLRLYFKVRHAPAYLKHLDDCCVARTSSEPAVTGNQRSAEFFRKYHVGCVVSGKIIAAPPNLRQQHEMGVPRNPEVLQIAHRLLSPACWNRSFPRQAPEDLGYFKIQQMRS